MSGAGLSRRLNHFTPLRYPGGKSKLAPFVKSIIVENDLEDGVYIEPFAGGAAIALQLLLQGYVSRVAINDLSWPIFCLWQAITEQPNEFIQRILDVPLTVAEWDRQKFILKNPGDFTPFVVGFSAFYLNRTNRSGVLNGGIIGGRAQVGEWLIDARFNREELAYRIERISRLKSQIDLTNLDCCDFLQHAASRYDKRSTLIYADPPYYVKGRQLYPDYFRSGDHENLARMLFTQLENWNWMVSYDDVPEVRRLYESQRIDSYAIPYSVRQSRMGSEVMFYSESLRLPFDNDGAAVGPADRFVA